MKIEKINDNKIRCTLTSADLAERNLKLSELAYGTEKARSLFQDMMLEANQQFGFNLFLGCCRLFFVFLLCRFLCDFLCLVLHIAELVEQVNDVVRAGILYRFRSVRIVAGWSKFGEAGVELLWILDSGDNEDNASTMSSAPQKR